MKPAVKNMLIIGKPEVKKTKPKVKKTTGKMPKKPKMPKK